jgi:phosphate transport system substrate-binding protein
MRRRIMSRMTTFVVTALTIFGLSAAASPAGAQELVRLCGTGDSQDLLRKIAAVFAKANPGVAVQVPDSIGSDGGVKAAAAGECEIGRVARPLKDKEKELNLVYKVFAYSPVLLVVNTDVTVNELTGKQIVDIYSGKVTSWGEVGGIPAKITVVNREAKDSSRNQLNEGIPGFKAIEKPVGMVAKTTPEAVETLMKTTKAIGYLPAAMAKDMPLKVLKVDGVAPTPASVVEGKYPVVSPFGLVWKGELKGAAARFIDFLKSPDAKKIIIDYGIVPADLM